ncbi:hypothetical protein INS49_015313 [Diaporthe citri]|uniref:uncharacterized protein n=1 Tax=Diaporthe citri TaxID=83186 RepID=UPI001C8138FF|nr:uncharacterized protein INS49_015313 [Diaporthe citri]KAG6355929.1 hypothetical protein INS49_015313 [Diaporthe citri]
MDADRTEPDETTRLLANQADEVRGSDNRSPVRRLKFLQKQIILLVLVLVLLQLHLIFFSSASGELKLRKLCYEYLKDHEPGKVGPGGQVDLFDCYFEEPVVQQLRELLNWDWGISSILLLLIVFPYGMVADLRGKKRVIILALVGQLLSCLWTVAVASFSDIFPLRLTWAASAFWLIGGGTPLSVALIYLLASESLHEEQRSQLYFFLYGAYLVTVTIFPTIAFIATLPSVYPRVVLPGQDSRQANFLTLLRSRKVLFILVIFTLPAFAQTAFQAVTPYLLVNRRPDETLQHVLLTIFSGEIFRVVLFAFFAPWGIAFAQGRFRIHQAKIDTWIIRGSLLLMAISGAFMTSATTVASRTIAVVVFFAGFGLRVPLLSYVTSLAGPKLRGRLYGTVLVAETIGQLIMWPISRNLMVNVHKRGDPWLEVPFVVMSRLCVGEYHGFTSYL